MYAKKVTALQWLDMHASGNPKRRFQALYVFDDGFETREECVQTLQALEYDEDLFALVCFCDQWYAVNITGYKNFVVVSKEHVIYKPEQFADEIVMIALSEVNPSTKPPAYTLKADWKKWAKGIEKDMATIDPDVAVFVAGAKAARNTIMVNNILITLGREFFRTEICIRTKGYAYVVLHNYYNDRSMEYAEEKITNLKSKGVEYYNPFTGETDENVRGKDKRTKAYLKKCKTFEEIK